jgi:hypothetical protein
MGGNSQQFGQAMANLHSNVTGNSLQQAASSTPLTPDQQGAIAPAIAATKASPNTANGAWGAAPTPQIGNGQAPGGTSQYQAFAASPQGQQMLAQQAAQQKQTAGGQGIYAPGVNPMAAGTK